MKSNKQKFLEQWQWLAANPTKSKEDHQQYLISEGRADEYHHCWACFEDAKRNSAANCGACPINWPHATTCMTTDSPFFIWFRYDAGFTEETFDGVTLWKRMAAEGMVNLIEKTWED